MGEGVGKGKRSTGSSPGLVRERHQCGSDIASCREYTFVSTNEHK